jgi:diguanylate cyclase (GGDEF)-like protein
MATTVSAPPAILYDELTNLPNRELCVEYLQEAVQHSRSSGRILAVLFIDLDEFKQINNTLGYAAGDEVLKQVAARLRTITREKDFLARVGGDEFVLVAGEFDNAKSIESLCGRLIESLSIPLSISDGSEVFIGASIGVSRFPVDGEEPDLLHHNADAAMNDARRNGKNGVRFFGSSGTGTGRERREMEARLRGALERSELELRFQPQFATDGTRPTRYEAFLRWRTAPDKIVSPADFIPLAEETGLIVPIGQWVLEEACRQAADWQKGELAGVGVSVNISPVQVAALGFADMVERTLKSAGLDPRLLELEITEAMFSGDLTVSSAVLAHVRGLGVTIALDDFGVGYSSLSQMQRLPVDALKIDKTFLTRKDHRQSAAVLRCVIGLAHTLSIRVVAEGVETEGHYSLLKRLGCDEMQGFLLGVPDRAPGSQN